MAGRLGLGERIVGKLKNNWVARSWGKVGHAWEGEWCTRKRRIVSGRSVECRPENCGKGGSAWEG